MIFLGNWLKMQVMHCNIHKFLRILIADSVWISFHLLISIFHNCIKFIHLVLRVRISSIFEFPPVKIGIMYYFFKLFFICFQHFTKYYACYFNIQKFLRVLITDFVQISIHILKTICQNCIMSMHLVFESSNL